MSFYSGNRGCCIPGQINGNPTNGICEKVCIHTEKVFDACLKQVQENDISVTATNFNPENPTDPLTFVSASCVANETTIENLVVDRFDDKPCFARVSGDVVIPITIAYTDANGVAGTATGTITLNQDVVLYVPQPSIVPFRVVAFANCVTPDGEYAGNGVFNLSTCITIIIKVVADADILIPSYGYVQVPPCQEYTQDVCSGFFELPLYPQTQQFTPCNN